jgi:hypothetical protein
MSKAKNMVVETAALTGGPSLLRVSDDYTITETEAARFLGLRSAKTLYFWRLKKTGPPWMRYGTRCIRYRVKDLIAWQERQLVSNETKEA